MIKGIEINRKPKNGWTEDTLPQFAGDYIIGTFGAWSNKWNKSYFSVKSGNFSGFPNTNDIDWWADPDEVDKEFDEKESKRDKQIKEFLNNIRKYKSSIADKMNDIEEKIVLLDEELEELGKYLYEEE